MRVELEDFVPYDQSVLWRLGQAYYAGRGIAAWTEDDVPFEGTNNAAFARQHADFFAAIAPDGPRTCANASATTEIDVQDESFLDGCGGALSIPISRTLRR